MSSCKEEQREGEKGKGQKLNGKKLFYAVKEELKKRKETEGQHTPNMVLFVPDGS